MKQITVGIMGGLICNENLGCAALTYSLLNNLESIKEKLGANFKYIIFEYVFQAESYALLSKRLNIDPSNISFCKIGFYENEDWKLGVKTIHEKVRMLSKIMACNVVIDITQGDSFTDIYGFGRFDNLTKVKELVLKLNKPLVLAPQTYGPFSDTKLKERARKAIEKAALVFSRDEASTKYLKSFCNVSVIETTDLAFGLPWISMEKADDRRIKIGLNPSGLLVNNKKENTDLNTKLVTNYDGYLKELVRIISSDSRYELHIIPHVGEDAVHLFDDIRNVVIHNKFDDPIEAKTCIAQMDIFIGARMHATIGAFSSGVVTIPTAYSRKFSGLYNSLMYPYVVDLTELSTEQAIAHTLALIDKSDELKAKVSKGNSIAKKKYEVIEKELYSLIREL